MKADTVIVPTDERMHATAAAVHPDCFACSSPKGLGLDFHVLPNGEVGANWQSHNEQQGYPGILHGGLIATLLDSAMTHVLFSRGIVGLTGELKVRYHQPLGVSQPVEIRARLCMSAPPLYSLEAEILQGEVVAAKAHAKFMA